MIILTRLDGKEILLNEQNIETAYESPDTVIVMMNGHTHIVTESVLEIMNKSTEFQRAANKRDFKNF